MEFSKIIISAKDLSTVVTLRINSECLEQLDFFKSFQSFNTLAEKSGGVYEMTYEDPISMHDAIIEIIDPEYSVISKLIGSTIAKDYLGLDINPEIKIIRRSKFTISSFECLIKLIEHIPRIGDFSRVLHANYQDGYDITSITPKIAEDIMSAHMCHLAIVTNFGLFISNFKRNRCYREVAFQIDTASRNYAFSRTGRYFAYKKHDSKIVVHDIFTGEDHRDFPVKIDDGIICFLTDQTILITTGTFPHQYLKVINFRTSKVKDFFQDPRKGKKLYVRRYNLEISEDGALAAHFYVDDLLAPENTHRIIIFNPETYEILKIIDHSYKIGNLFFSRDNKKLICHVDINLVIFDLVNPDQPEIINLGIYCWQHVYLADNKILLTDSDYYIFFDTDTLEFIIIKKDIKIYPCHLSRCVYVGKNLIAEAKFDNNINETYISYQYIDGCGVKPAENLRSEVRTETRKIMDIHTINYENPLLTSKLNEIIG